MTMDKLVSNDSNNENKLGLTDEQKKLINIRSILQFFTKNQGKNCRINRNFAKSCIFLRTKDL